jgi:adenine phosphoribosyltransferase
MAEVRSNYITDVPDFPKDGIIFKDITPLLQNPLAFNYVIGEMCEPYKSVGIDAVASPESRGFIFGVPVAQELRTSFVPIRKPGKLPRQTVRKTYDLEYGSDAIEMHSDSIISGERVLMVDDLLATGGTIEAAADMVKGLGGEIAGFCFLIELSKLEGRKKLERFGADIHSLIKYDSE